MSPRPRTASNADILAGAMRAVGRVGPAQLTLAEIARETKLAPATLIQRFGSKRALLLAAVEHEAAVVDDRLAAARAAHPSPLGALVAAASEVARPFESPAAVANHTAFHLIGLADRDFHRLALEHSRRILAGYRSLIAEAIAAGELTPVEADRLARSVHTTVGGALANWAIHRDGALLPWIRADLDALLAPLRAPATPAGAAAIATAMAPASTAAAAPHAGLPSPDAGTPRPPAGPRARHKL